MYSSRSLSGRVAVVTGAGGRGIGTAIARQLAEDGAFVYLNGLRKDPLREITEEIRVAGGKAAWIQADIADPSQVESMIAKVVDDHGTLDVLVHNAARGAENQRIDQMSIGSWTEDIGVILTGAFLCCHFAVKVMTKVQRGRIVFVSSSAALRGSWGRATSYAAAKAGLHGVTKQLALELGAFGITVNAVAPGQIDTPRARRGGRRTTESLEQYGRYQVPLQRVGKPSDVSSLISFLASDQAQYITGQIIVVDGGASLASPATRVATANAT